MTEVVKKCEKCGADLAYDPIRRVLFCPECNPEEPAEIMEKIGEEA